MARHAISCVVITETNRAIGMFSERDIPGILLASSEQLERPISTIMTPPQTTIGTGTSTVAALELMHRRGIRRLIVSADSGCMAGLVTRSLLGRAVVC